ncbi:uncharacterized protein LOC114533601 [Dendronephthya gigantea]|uniref:uncharacterized protein LOC114533601 n=1 Tax=Dendronephthya gigantea TaxID=151771 RepID=UPI0010691FE9|nr:uncharacterized protein LOC114533601 [Dendronephthya gigantea]
MDDEVILAAILLAAAGLLLILTIIMLCLIFKASKTKSEKKSSRSEIPRSSHDNTGFQRDNGVSMYENKSGNMDTRVSQSNGENKAEWPSSYNMYAVSRSYAFPKTGDHSEQSSELGSKAQPSNPPSTFASRSSTLITREVQHKTFSEEVFEGINQDAITDYTTSTTLPRSETNDSRVWKSRTASETVSLHSHDTNSVRGSVTQRNSYYSSFKPRNASVSKESISQVVEVSTNSGITRQKLATHSIKTSGSTKVFSFDLK